MLILQQLYVLAPNFHDTTARLYQATLNYARQLDAAGDPCGAAEHYAEAQTLQADPQVADALAEAQAACALTPTPEGGATTPAADGTPVPAGIPEPDGTPVIEGTTAP